MGYLAFIIVAVTAFVFGLNWRFKSGPSDSLPDVGFGRTTWTYYLELYFAPWNRYQPYLVWPIIQAVCMFPDKGWSSSWIHPSPHAWQGCQGGPGGQRGAVAGEPIEPKSELSSRSPSLLPLLSSMVCTTWDLVDRPHFSWQLPTTLCRLGALYHKKWLFFRDWPGAFPLPGSYSHAPR